jgi:hypothetical protein
MTEIYQIISEIIFYFQVLYLFVQFTMEIYIYHYIKGYIPDSIALGWLACFFYLYVHDIDLIEILKALLRKLMGK